MHHLLDKKKLYYTISEVSKAFDIAPSTLRFWEGAFPRLKPKKSKRGIRQYTAEDVQYIEQIQYLTKTCNYTLEGARKKLDQTPGSALDQKTEALERLATVREKLVALRDALKDRKNHQHNLNSD